MPLLAVPPRSEEIDQSELADDDWWVAQIDSCYSLPQEGETDLGVLKVTWMYSKDDVPKLKYLHDGFKTKLLKYRMDDNERIASDHYDFIGKCRFLLSIASACSTILRKLTHDRMQASTRTPAPPRACITT